MIQVIIKWAPLASNIFFFLKKKKETSIVKFLPTANLFQRLVFHCGHGGVHALRLVAHLAWPGHKNALESA